MPQQFIKNPLDQFESERLPVGWPWRFFSISLVIFFASLLTYFGLLFGSEPYLTSQLAQKDEAVNQLAEKISAEDREKFTRFYSQLVNLKNLLENHVKPSQVFALLEKTANQKVFYRSASIRVPEKELNLEGITDSYETLAGQLESYKEAGEIDSFIMTQSQLNEGLVQFKVVLKLKEGTLK